MVYYELQGVSRLRRRFMEIGNNRGLKKEMHPILLSQLRKNGLEEGDLPADRAAWAKFLESVDSAYKQADKKLQAYLESSNEPIQESRNQIAQSEKMASLGQLAAGVAHEINNPVSYLISNLDRLSEYVAFFTSLWRRYDELERCMAGGDIENGKVLLTRIEELKKAEDFPFMREDVQNLVVESKEGANRVNEIVRNMKTFAHADEPDMKEADLNVGMEATLKLAWNELKYKCNLVKNLDPLPKIRCHPGRLNQVFMNILVNAGQAIRNHGEIRVSSNLEGERIVIRISDTGEGIVPADLKKIFTPFFTTKPVGTGTGLGLSISYGIVKNHGGDIQVVSEVGKGTTFSVFLPVSGTKTED